MARHLYCGVSWNGSESKIYSCLCFHQFTNVTIINSARSTKCNVANKLAIVTVTVSAIVTVTVIDARGAAPELQELFAVVLVESQDGLEEHVQQFGLVRLLVVQLIWLVQGCSGWSGCSG